MFLKLASVPRGISPFIQGGKGGEYFEYGTFKDPAVFLGFIKLGKEIWGVFSNLGSVYLLAMVMTSKRILNNSVNPCIVPDLERNTFSFSPLRIMFSVGLLDIAILW